MPGRTLSLGQLSVVTMSPAMSEPRWISQAATTTGTVSVLATPGSWLMSLLASTAAAPPNTRARTTIKIVRRLTSHLPVGVKCQRAELLVRLTRTVAQHRSTDQPRASHEGQQAGCHH